MSCKLRLLPSRPAVRGLCRCACKRATTLLKPHSLHGCMTDACAIVLCCDEPHLRIPSRRHGVCSNGAESEAHHCVRVS